MSHEDENAYESLAEASGDVFAGERWAFGTGFDDPLAGVDPTVSDDVDAAELAGICLALADDALVLSQRLALWVSNTHELEDEVALANIALDLLGQARLLLTRSAQANPQLRPAEAPAHVPDEDALAYWREAPQFTNVRLAELDDERDFARCIARLLVLTTWRLATMTQLTDSADPVLSAIAAKAVTELSYHREYASGWVIRLGDGTEFSHAKMQQAVGWAWSESRELFDHDLFGREETRRDEVVAVLRQVCDAATVDIGPSEPRGEPHGRDGRHGPELAALLENMHVLARADPEATW
jgi:ring-1,2-phenylacetyl-CoA epoxidase subunit PaaC